MIETREKEINGAMYTVSQLPARRAIRLKAKLIKLFGPVLAQVFLNVGDVKSEQASKDSIVHAIELLGSSINEIEFENLVVELLQGVRKNGVELQPGIIDLEFAGDMAGLYQVCWFVIEVNYANFFSMLGIGNHLSESIQSPAITKKTFTKNSRTS
jgi:hypothetical protein